MRGFTQIDKCGLIEEIELNTVCRSGRETEYLYTQLAGEPKRLAWH